MKALLALVFGLAIGGVVGAVLGVRHQLNWDAEWNVANRNADCASWARVREIEAARAPAEPPRRPEPAK
jgi:hypothetical protein